MLTLHEQDIVRLRFESYLKPDAATNFRAEEEARGLFDFLRRRV